MNGQQKDHNCFASRWRLTGASWYCVGCGRYQCTVTGRVSVRNPEPFDFRPLHQRYAYKEGPDTFIDGPDVEYPYLETVFAWDLTKAEDVKAFHEAYDRSLGWTSGIYGREDQEWGGEQYGI